MRLQPAVVTLGAFLLLPEGLDGGRVSDFFKRKRRLLTEKSLGNDHGLAPCAERTPRDVSYQSADSRGGSHLVPARGHASRRNAVSGQLAAQLFAEQAVMTAVEVIDAEPDEKPGQQAQPVCGGQ